MSRRERNSLRIQTRVEGTTLHTRVTQPNESEILQANHRQRMAGPNKGWGARITDIERERWRRAGREDLLKGDRKALEKFIASPEGRKYDLMPRGKSRGFSAGGR